MKTLSELFDNPSPWEWSKNRPPDRYQDGKASFKTKSGLDVVVDVYRAPWESGGHHWMVQFRLSYKTVKGRRVNGSSFELTGTGDQFEILSTVINIVKDFVRRVQPETLGFGAKGTSRVKTYGAIFSRIDLEGYEKRQETLGNRSVYMLYRQDADQDETDAEFLELGNLVLEAKTDDRIGRLEAVLSFHDEIADHPARNPGIPNEAHLKDYRKKLEELKDRLIKVINLFGYAEEFEGSIEGIEHELQLMYQDNLVSSSRYDPGGGLHADNALTLMHGAISALEWMYRKQRHNVR